MFPDRPPFHPEKAEKPEERKVERRAGKKRGYRMVLKTCLKILALREEAGQDRRNPQSRLKILTKEVSKHLPQTRIHCHLVVEEAAECRGSLYLNRRVLAHFIGSWWGSQVQIQYLVCHPLLR